MIQRHIYTLEKLNDLWRNLCSILKLSEVLFNLVWIEASTSFIVVWLIPNEVVSKVAESFSHVEEIFFKAQHILMIVLDEMLVYFSNSTDDKVSGKILILPCTVHNLAS